MSMKTLILGANGQVGWELVRQAGASKLDFVALTRHELDVTRLDQITHQVCRANPHIIVNATAYTAVDKAETEPERAFAVNRDAVANLASVCRDLNIPLIHISTDYVFDGTKTDPYVETDVTNTLGAYGRSKLAGEESIRQVLPQHYIIRTSWVFGSHGNNFVKTMLKLGEVRDELRVVNDQVGSPTSAAMIAKLIFQIINTIQTKNPLPWGTYHFGGAPFVSWFEFAQAIFGSAAKREIKTPKNLIPISTLEYPTPAQRPANSRLDSGKLESYFRNNVHDDWRTHLATVMDDIVQY